MKRAAGRRRKFDSMFAPTRLMKLLEKLLDAAGALAVATAVLYFWGYVYYATYTEKVGVPFHGIAIPLQEYLTASWYAVAMLLFAILTIAMLAPMVGLLLDALANRVRRRLGRAPLSDKERGFGPLSPIVILVLSVFAIFGGVKLMLVQAQSEAERVLRIAPEVKIWTPDGEPIAGRFVYLRNFGSTLLVSEMSADMKTPLGYRFFKDSAYSSYSLVPQSWSVRWRPTTDKLP